MKQRDGRVSEGTVSEVTGGKKCIDPKIMKYSLLMEFLPGVVNVFN